MTPLLLYGLSKAVKKCMNLYRIIQTGYVNRDRLFLLLISRSDLRGRIFPQWTLPRDCKRRLQCCHMGCRHWGARVTHIVRPWGIREGRQLVP